MCATAVCLGSAMFNRQNITKLEFKILPFFLIAMECRFPGYHPASHQLSIRQGRGEVLEG